jgi:hypothetical protein
MEKFLRAFYAYFEWASILVDFFSTLKEIYPPKLFSERTKVDYL